ncbi:MAG: CBS domain-containing protein [Acidobacteriaceae bacterium]
MKSVPAAKGSVPQLRNIMSTHVVTVGPKVAASVALAKMRRRGIRHLLVTENGRQLGIVSERRLGGREGGASIRQRRMVEDLMTPRVASVESTATLGRAVNLMREQKVSCVLITDKGEPTGIVTASDVFDELGRDPVRAPFPGWVSKAARMEAAAHAQPIPAHIRVLGTELDSEKRKFIRQELGARLGKFGHSIERVSVRVEDANGPRGGIDQVCRIKVVLSNLPSVVFESRNASLDVAIGESLADIEQVLRRTLQRRRMKPIRTAGRAGLPAED